MLVRLGFAVAVHVDPEVLLIDEVLAVGDEAFQAKCLDRVRAFQRDGRTIVLVTHALDTVIEICDRAVMLAPRRAPRDRQPGRRRARDAVRCSRRDRPELRPRGGHPRGRDRRGPDRPPERLERGRDPARRPAHDRDRRPPERAARRPGRGLRRPGRGDEPRGARRADLARRAGPRALRQEARAVPDRGLPVRARQVLGDGRVVESRRPGTCTTCRPSGTCSRSSTRRACRSSSRSRWRWRSRTCDRAGDRSRDDADERNPSDADRADPVLGDAGRGRAADAQARHEPRERRARARRPSR